jgi:hypothetical protein
MVRVNLETLVMGSLPGASVLMLRPAADEAYHDRVLPICIGSVEAAAIGKAVSREASARPMTHELMGSIMAQLDGRLARVVIDKVKGTVFYATLCIQRGIETIKIDARPSDAIALAVRLKAPLFVEESVMASASFPSWVNTPKEQERAQIEEFHQFVETLEPSDFVWEEPNTPSEG